jgi:CRP/FNR family transcriptional regulator, cyclic AMP receptor protein
VNVNVAPEEMSWHLRRFSVFEHFDRHELQSVTRVLHMRQYSPREAVYLSTQPRDNVYFLLTGRVKVTRIDAHTGKELILYIIRPGELFGLLRGRHGSEHAGNSAIAMERSMVGYVPRPDFERLAQRRSVAAELNRMADERLMSVTHRLEEMVFRDVPSRLADLLLRLAEQFPRERDGVRGIDVRLTQQDIADMIGSTRESASIVINDFKRRGLLDVKRRNIWLVDDDALQEIAAGP